MPDSDKQDGPNKFFVYSQLGVQMGVIIGGGAYLGMWLDERNNRDDRLYTLICTLSAVIIAMVIMIREVIKLTKNK